MNYFLIPGNPPAVSFYKLWQDEIKAKHPFAQIRVAHYPKLQRTRNSHQAMNEILSSHLDQLNDFHREITAPITIIGHSLGGNFALKLLDVADDKIHQSILIHPFLRMPKKKGQLILKTVAALHEFQPLQKMLVTNRKILEYFSDELPHVSDEEMGNSFHIAKHESVIISPDQSPVKIDHAHRDKVLVFYHNKDTWCTPIVINQLRGQVALHECSEPHGFITNQKERQTLFDKIQMVEKLK